MSVSQSFAAVGPSRLLLGLLCRRLQSKDPHRALRRFPVAVLAAGGVAVSASPISRGRAVAVPVTWGAVRVRVAKLK